MFDLTSFSLRDMSELGSVLRGLGRGASSMEEVANRTVECLRAELVDPEAKGPACPLVRFFKTHPCDALAPELQSFAQARLPGGKALAGMRCLTLLATAGERPAWNARERSEGHQAIPLASREMVAQAPMIASLLQQLGVEVAELLAPRPGLLVESAPSSFNIFYVPEARGSPLIPAQKDFVVPVGIRSVLGFGGRLPLGDIFVVVLFARVHVPRETAEMFRTLALNLKLAVLPFEERVFAGAERAA